MRYTFKGGIHLPDMKSETRDMPIKTLSPPEKIVIPLKQHIGALLDPLVKVGENVKRGSLLRTAKPLFPLPSIPRFRELLKALSRIFTRRVKRLCR